MCILTELGHSRMPTSNEEMKLFWAGFGHEVNENFEPIAKPAVFNKSQLESENKNLMAHVMVELGLFPSVGQAKKNGWDKPLELGQYTATKKKIRFEIIS